MRYEPQHSHGDGDHYGDVVGTGRIYAEMDPARVPRIISLQYNPDSLSRMLHIQAAKRPHSLYQFGPYAPLVAAERITR